MPSSPSSSVVSVWQQLRPLPCLLAFAVPAPLTILCNFEPWNCFYVCLYVWTLLQIVALQWLSGFCICFFAFLFLGQIFGPLLWFPFVATCCWVGGVVRPNLRRGGEWWRRSEWSWRVRTMRCSKWKRVWRSNRKLWRIWSRTRVWIIRFRSPMSPARFWPKWLSTASTMSTIGRLATTNLLRRRTKSRRGIWTSWRWTRLRCLTSSW